MQKQRSGYFQLSMEKVMQVASATRDYYAVAGYLVLARHCTSESIAGAEPFTFSGAGQNAIKEKVKISEARAAGVLDRLKEIGAIREAPTEVRRIAAKSARYELVRDKLTLDLPHAFTDGLGSTSSALARFKDVGMNSGYRDKLKDLQPEDAKLDALMLMVHAYKNMQMDRWGGIRPTLFFRRWQVHSKRAGKGGFTWMADLGEDAEERMYPDQCRPIFAYAQTGSEKKPVPHPLVDERFWNAHTNLRSAGLIYEAVTWATGEFQSDKAAKAICTLRVNDFHADTRGNTPDPGLMKLLGEFAYYTNPENDRSEEEQLKALLPSQAGAIVGIYRPRFRAINSDTGAWLERETATCEDLASRVLTDALKG